VVKDSTGLLLWEEYHINSAVKVAESFPLIVNTRNISFITYDILYNVESGKMEFRTH
jgi:hypothetical protein